MSESQYWTNLRPVQTCWESAPTCRVNTASESVVSRKIGENSQISRQQIQSSSYFNLVKWWVKHFSWFKAWIFSLSDLSSVFSDVTIIHLTVISHVKSVHCARASRQPSTRVLSLVSRDLMPKILRALTTWHLLQQRQGASSVESHNVERTAISIFPETIKLWDNQNRVYAAPAEMFWHSRHPQILWFWWVLWCKFYQFSNDLIDPKAWVAIELQISTGNFGFTDPLLLYESS